MIKMEKHQKQQNFQTGKQGNTPHPIKGACAHERARAHTHSFSHVDSMILIKKGSGNIF